MSGWGLFWAISFGSTLVLFAGMALWVTVAGYRDLRRLFRRLDEVHREAERRDEAGE